MSPIGLKYYGFLWLVYTVFSVQSVHAQWEIKNPQTNYATTYANIFIQDDVTGFLLPADGFARILRTRDKGETWEERVLPSTLAGGIDVMTSAGPLNLWAGNKQGIVLHSIDGGDSWKSFFYASPVLSINFFDSLTGWILTEDQKLRHTMDGGKTWKTFTASYKHIYAINKNTVLAGNGSYAFVSYNKGETWEYLGCGCNPFESLANELFYSEPCNRMNSYRMNKNGLFSSREREFYNIARGGINPHIYGVNPTHRWSIWHQNNLAFSSDWQNDIELSLELNFPSGIGFFDENNGILISNYTLLKTRDGGQSFQSSMVFRNKRETLTDLIFTSPQTAFMSAYQTELGSPVTSELYKSIDGGSTWTSFIVDTKHGYSNMALLDEHLFIVGGKGTIARIQISTKQIQTITLDTTYLNDIVFFGNGIGLVCGEHGRLFRSTDRGQSWMQISIPDQPRLFQLEVIDDGKIIRMNGPEGYVLQSLDSGISWGQLPLPDSTAVSMGMHFLNSDTGAVVGYDISSFPPSSNLFRTYDGGVSWDKFQISMGNNYMTGMGIIPYMMDDGILLGTGDGIAKLGLYSINFETEYTRGFGGPSKFVKDPSGGIWAVCSWSTLLHRETMGPFSLLSPENNALLTLDSTNKLALEWEKVKGAYEYRVFFKGGDNVVERTVGDFLLLSSDDTYKMFLDKVQLTQILHDLGLDAQEGSFEWNVWAINTEDTIKMAQSRTLNYRVLGESSYDPFNFTLIPNPAKDQVKIYFETAVWNNLAVQITDVGGKSIQTRYWENCQCGYIEVDTYHLSQGVYFVTLIRENTRTSGKLVIAR
ncbi:MAG: T9SS type A sorting domain-containing protein [Bacteroidia bacterium]